MKVKRTNKADPAQFMSGWKDIARYLDKGVRTVQRYEREFGLPVRRPAGKPRGSVVATKAEIEAWVNASPIRETYRLSPRPMEISVASLAQIQAGINEMMRLRDQMAQLRSEVRASVRVLRESVGDLEQQVSHSWGGALRPMLMDSDDHSMAALVMESSSPLRRTRAS